MVIMASVLFNKTAQLYTQAGWLNFLKFNIQKSTKYFFACNSEFCNTYKLTAHCSWIQKFPFHLQQVQCVFAYSQFSYDENVPQPGVLLPYLARTQNQYLCCLAASASWCWVSGNNHISAVRNRGTNRIQRPVVYTPMSQKLSARKIKRDIWKMGCYWAEQ